MSDTTVGQVRIWLERLQAGDKDAHNKLIEATQHRLEKLTRKMLGDFPKVKRWSDTSDVQQNATLRLWKSLEEVKPGTVKDYFRFAATQIRRELIDLSRRYSGPEGLAANHHSWQPRDGNNENGVNPIEPQLPEDKSEVSRLLQWTEFHSQVENLPEEQKAVFDLLWYQGLPQQEAAEVLGNSFWTLRRHYRQAKVTLHESLNGEWPS